MTNTYYEIQTTQGIERLDTLPEYIDTGQGLIHKDTYKALGQVQEWTFTPTGYLLLEYYENKHH